MNRLQQFWRDINILALLRAIKLQGDKTLKEIDDLKTAFTTFRADFNKFATDVTAKLGNPANPVDAAAIAEVTAAVQAMDTQVNALDAALNPTPAGGGPTP